MLTPQSPGDAIDALPFDEAPVEPPATSEGDSTPPAAPPCGSGEYPEGDN